MMFIFKLKVKNHIHDQSRAHYLFLYLCRHFVFCRNVKILVDILDLFENEVQITVRNTFIFPKVDIQFPSYQSINLHIYVVDPWNIEVLCLFYQLKYLDILVLVIVTVDQLNQFFKEPEIE